MKLHKISIAAILAVIAMTGCRQETQTGKQPASSSFAAVSSTCSSNTDNTSTAADGPTTSKGEGENSTASSEAASHSSAVISSKGISSIRSEPPMVSSKPKPPVTSASASSAGNPSSAQEPDKQEPPAKKDPYAYPFDIEAIKADLIEYGEKTLKMKHRTVTEERYYDATVGKWIEAGTPITPENSGWWGGYVLSKNEHANPSMDKKKLYEYLKFDHDTFEMTSFTIYVKPLSDGAYQIYVLR